MGWQKEGWVSLVLLVAALGGFIEAISNTNGATNRIATKPPVAGGVRLTGGARAADPSAAVATASQKTTTTMLKSVSEGEKRSQPAGLKRNGKAAAGVKASQPEAARIARRDGLGAGNMPELTLEEDTSETYLSDDTTLDSKGNPTMSTVLSDDGSTLTSTPEYESDGSEIVDSLSDSPSTPPSGAQQQVSPSANQQLKAQQQQIAHLRSQLAASNTQISQQHQPVSIHGGSSSVAQAEPHLQVTGPGNHHHHHPHGHHQTLLPDARQLFMGARQPVSLAGHQQGLPTQPSTPVSTFNLNMGADRMMIKQQPRSPLDHQELATESIQHELMSRDVAGQNGHLLDQERRQAELMYAAAAAGKSLDSASQPGASIYGEPNVGMSHQHPPTCYSPLALLMVILTTMLVTLLACLVTHLLIKHLSRHQFDLIANNHFETKHGFGSQERRHFNQGSRASLWAASGRDGYSRSSSVLNMLIHQRPPTTTDNLNPKQLRLDQQQQQQTGCAFDNPYFREESWSVGRPTNRPANTQVNESTLTPTNSHPPNSKDSMGSASSSEHLNFIESHISNLHSRQVTSSVKELSVNSNTPPAVVDLTSDEHRARVIADPKEGDLVAVDISGHDFMGLGFDVCGNAQQGIFVRSVLSRGPARDSGCIHPGDRLKCINISFDQMTLQDACDILNSGSPYKLRLLIEKRAAPPKLADKFRQTAPILLRRNNRFQNQLLNQQQQHQSGANQLHFNGLFTFKSCLRRLTDIFTPSPKKQASVNSFNSTLTAGQLDYRTSQFGVRSPVAGGSEFLEQHPSLYLGSSAARRHFPQSRPDSSSLFGSHMNTDYSGSANLADTDDERAAFDGATMRAAATATTTTGKLSSDSHLFESSASSVNGATGGANQRLNKLTSQDLESKQHHNYQQASGDTVTTKRTAANHLHHQISHNQNSSSSHQAPPSRRQSLATLNDTNKSQARVAEQKPYLEQTQSQPEMSRHTHQMMVQSDTFARAGKESPGERRSGDDMKRNKAG